MVFFSGEALTFFSLYRLGFDKKLCEQEKKTFELPVELMCKLKNSSYITRTDFFVAYRLMLKPDRRALYRGKRSERIYKPRGERDSVQYNLRLYQLKGDRSERVLLKIVMSRVRSTYNKRACV